MICKDAYLAALNNFYCYGNELVEKIWLAAEAAMQKKSIQKPMLEFKQAMKADMQDQQDIQFTQQELQFLKTVIKEEIGYVQDDKNTAIADAAYLYNLCDKENDLASGRFFTLMNKARTNVRKCSAKLSKLEQIQRKIKKQMS